MSNYGAHLRQCGAIGKRVSQQHRARKQVYTLQFTLHSNFFFGGGVCFSAPWSTSHALKVIVLRNVTHFVSTSMHLQLVLTLEYRVVWKRLCTF